MTDDRQAEIFAFEHGFQPLRPFDIGDLRLDANLGQLRGDDLTPAAGVGGGRQVQCRLEPIGETGLGQQRLGFFGIVAAQLRQVDVIGVMRCEMGADGRAIAEHRTVDDRLPVDGTGHRLAHFNVIERFALVVDRQDRFALGRADQHLKPRIRFELGDVLGRGKAGENIDILGHDGSESRCRVRNELERRAGQRGRFAPIVFIPGQGDLVALVPVLKFESAGADWGLFDRLDRLWRHDHRIAPSEVEQHVAVRLAQFDLNGLRVDDIHLGNRGIKCLLRVGAVFGIDPVEGEFHILGIHRGAIVKGNPLTQLEGIGQPVFGNFPRFCQPRHDRAIAHEAGQTFENIGI